MRPLAFALLLLLTAPAVGLAQEAPSIDPRVERWLDRADALLARGRASAATRSIERALERAPGEPRLLATIGAGLPPDAATAAELAADERAARAEWALALTERFEPDSPEGARARDQLRGWAEAVRGHEEAALTLVSEAAGVHDEGSATMLRRLAALFVRRGSLTLARRALTLALRAWSRDPTLVTDLAALELERGMPAEAVRLLRSELAHRPEHELLREDFAGALLAAGRRAEAIRVWRALADDATDAADQGRFRRAAAQAALAEGRYETARVEARRALGVAPEDGEARLLLGLALVGLDRPDPARVALQKARRLLGPDDLRVERALSALDTPPEGAEETQR